MSIQTLVFVERLSLVKLSNVKLLTRSFSRRTSSEGSFKSIKDRRSPEETNLAWRDPSFELLAPTTDFPFYLPGNVGLAWYDTQTTIKSRHEFIIEQMETVPKKRVGDHDFDIVCRIQNCPTVLRQGVEDLFPYKNFEKVDLSVVTISLKPNLRDLRKNREMETEKLAQLFVLSAKNICAKLHHAGYWADFINPFSGRPYLRPNAGKDLYETDPKFRCLDFQIFEIKNCTIVSNEGDESTLKRFVGSLFTNAPSKKNYLNNIFTQ